MTVAEFMEKHAQDNNGTIKFWSRKTKTYKGAVSPDTEIKRIRVYKGFGYNQFNTVLEIE